MLGLIAMVNGSDRTVLGALALYSITWAWSGGLGEDESDVEVLGAGSASSLGV